MKKYIILTLFFTVLSIVSKSQVIYKKGHFINESGEKIICLIRNVDRKKNPGEVQYKISKGDKVLKADIHSVKEFEIYGVAKFVRTTVKMDRSTDDEYYMGYEKDPVFKEETLFLRVLIEGKASLYSYMEKDLKRFFYQFSDTGISQLVYKRYKYGDNVVLVNAEYRVQLYVEFKCEDDILDVLNQLDYTKKDLIKFFVDYNKCSNSEYTKYRSNQKQKLVHISVRPGLNINNLSVWNDASHVMDTDFGNRIGYRIGVEAELMFPYTNNRWGVIVEPTYQKFTTEKTTGSDDLAGLSLVSKVNYQSFEIPVGIRHYIFLNTNSKIFVNASYVFDFSYDSDLKFSRKNGNSISSANVSSKNNISIGLGYKYKNKFGLELRYHTDRELYNDYPAWNSEFKTLSVIFAYNLF